MDPAVRERVEAACVRGGTSIHSTGVSPGFISEAVPIVLTSLQRRLDRLRI
jgi:4-hydroxy-tetrahydrodipicolinate reductase